MKKTLMIILLLVISSCTFIPTGQNTISVTKTPIELTIPPTNLPQITQPSNTLVERVYDSREWRLIYQKDMVWQVDVNANQQLWMMLDRGEIAFSNGDSWVMFSKKDLGFSDKPSDLVIAPDGIVWVSGGQVVSRYQEGNWDTIPIPNVSKTAVTRLAVDSSNIIWAAVSLCNCEKNIRKFDGTTWDELPTIDQHLEVSQLLFTSDESLWASFGWPGGIGHYDGQSWKIYPGTDLWPQGPYSAIRIAPDKAGNIFAIYERQNWVIKISKDQEISKIPFDALHLELNPALLRLFVDAQDVLWVNACLKDARNACLAYYQNNQWVSFTNLPFSTVTDINELSDGTLLVATERGLYQFRSTK